MELIEASKHLGLISFIIVLVAGGVILYKLEITHSRSLSMHIADERWAYLFFAIASTISAIFFHIFVQTWLIPKFSLSLWFMGLIIFGSICQLLAAWVPHTTGRQALYHSIFAYIMAVHLPILLVMLAFAPLTFAAFLVVCVAAVLMIVLLGLLIFKPSTKRHFLPYQTLYIVSFFAAILVVTYVG